MYPLRFYPHCAGPVHISPEAAFTDGEESRLVFSTGAENSSYIISMLGVAIWYIAVPWKRSRLDLCLLIFCFVLTSLSPTDLFPSYIRTYWIRAFALKSLPVVIIWLKLVWEMCTKDYTTEQD